MAEQRECIEQIVGINTVSQLRVAIADFPGEIKLTTTKSEGLLIA